jgi:site-specific DNA-methyltransferase (adenine-specific)
VGYVIDLRHGDCLEVMADIADGSVDMVLTDPPYGTTACKWDSVIPFDPMWAHLKRITKKNGAIVMTASQPFTSALIMSNVSMFKYCWIWEKTRASNPYLAKIQPLRAHEDILVFGLGSPVYYPQKTDGGAYIISPKSGGRVASDTKTNSVSYNGATGSGRYPRTVQKVSNSSTEAGLHPTQKPVALMEYLIKTYTNEGETVLDFTMGSGTTGVAAKNLNRSFIGIERDEAYFNIAKERIETC